MDDESGDDDKDGWRSERDKKDVQTRFRRLAGEFLLIMRL